MPIQTAIGNFNNHKTIPKKRINIELSANQGSLIVAKLLKWSTLFQRMLKFSLVKVIVKPITKSLMLIISNGLIRLAVQICISGYIFLICGRCIFDFL